jgi:signal transduction histidine kinase
VRQRNQSGQPVKGQRVKRPNARKVSTSGPSVGDLQKQLDALGGELKEAREQQTATVEVLQVINSSRRDLAPVFDVMLQKALSLCAAAFGQLVTFDGVSFRAAAWQGYEPGPGATAPLPGMALHQLVHGKRIVHIPDITADDVYRSGNPVRRRLADEYGGRTAIWVALRKDEELLGAFVIFRTEVRPFSDKQIALLQGFAAQAVIAMENARLLTETREALERQTATADILKVIAGSPSNVQPVFEAMVNSAAKLFEPCAATITTLKDGKLHFNATAALQPGFNIDAARAVYPIPFDPGRAPSARAILERRIIEIPDTDAPDTPEFTRKAAAAGGFRSAVFVPLINEGNGIGTIILSHPQVGFRLSEKQLALVRTFADQAVIAIQNTRLFNETTQALEQQTATADILKVIASSPDDVQPVFRAIAERSNQLVGGLSTAVFRIGDNALQLMAFTPVSPEADAALQAFYPQSLSKLTRGDQIRVGEIVRIADTEVDFGARSAVRDLARKRGWRSALFVPLMRDRTPIGMISVTRVRPGLFADHHVQLLQTFADQAVIAISNVELFKQVQLRTRELSRSLEDLRTAQDRLIQTEKLASLGQLTAGIAHEIKNPLNFVNNFSALSVELTDELNDVLRRTTLANKIRAEVNELTGLLKDNLDRVVQHGKRADSIVKNMLLHSREGSGERRSADINALIGESLNLAYHGARAEKPGFTITLKHDLDPNVGALDLYPQEITRALLNLISNGFYAAIRRKAESGDETFVPVLSAATRDLGETVEIRIRDNGTGISPEVRAKMFNPFFTTKPTGEGTGLGLSMTHDIIVKQHGGSIDVDTEPGAFTEIIITLPRDNGTANGQKSE